MAAKGNGTTQYVRAAGTVSNPDVYSAAFWYKADHVPGTGVIRQPLGIRNDAGTAGRYDVNFSWDYTDSTIYKAVTHREAGGTYRRCQISDTPPANTWILIAFTYDGSSNLKVYVNGVLKGTTTGVGAPSNDAPLIAVCAYSPTIGFDTAYVGEVAVWNAELTQAEIVQIYQETSAFNVQNGALLSYFPANADSDETVGPNMVNSGCAFNKTMFPKMVGGIGIGAPSSNVHMIQSTGGGIKLGGGMATRRQFSSPGGILLGGSMDSFVQLGNGAFVMKQHRGNAESRK